MADLVVTGPPALELRWDHHADEQDGEVVRDLFPERTHAEPRGYLHGGVAAAAFVAAARLAGGAAGEPAGVVVAADDLAPLGTDLRLALGPADGGVREGRILHVRDPETEEEVVEPIVRGAVRFGEREPVPDLPDVRQLAGVPVPEATGQTIFPLCYVCGAENPRGLGLLPGWHAEDRAIAAFAADERFVEDEHVSPLAIVAVLSCPTLWACVAEIDRLDAPGAVLGRYEVRLHHEPRPTTLLRLVGWAGEHDGGTLRAASALVDEDGTSYATTSATWFAVEEVPDRDPEKPPPLHSVMPAKAGRPEDRSDEAWGEPLPGRREAPGPRTQRPGSGAELGTRRRTDG